MKFVVAGNFGEFLSHMNEMGYDHSEYVYVSDIIQLRGLTEVEGCYIGTWRERPDIDEIRELIDIIKLKMQLKNYTITTNNGVFYV